jgi:hypothetical protein
MEDIPVSQTQVLPSSIDPMTPVQAKQERTLERPTKAVQTGITQRYRDHDRKLVSAFNELHKLLGEGYYIAKTSEDAKYFNGRIVEFRKGLDEFVTVSVLGGRRKTKKKRSRRS